ncbi:MAG: hypothetical protein ACJKTH_00175 [Patescibacteria group bacterium UBA2163]
MHILICTPLFPPDVEPIAQYVQELARRLSDTHTVTVLTYGALPEPTDGVDIQGVSKDQLTVTRILRYTHKLFTLQRKADIVLAINGASVELPLVLTAPFSRARSLFNYCDTRAHEAQQKNIFLRTLHMLARARAAHTLCAVPATKPEILPFSPQPIAAQKQYEADWKAHKAHLESLFI